MPAMPNLERWWRADVLLACLVSALVAPVLGGLDSIAACSGRSAGDACTFRLPTVEDRWEDIRASREGAAYGGACSHFGRDGLHNSSSQEALLFCRAVPAAEEVEACVDRAARKSCLLRRNESFTLMLEAYASERRWAGTSMPVFASFLTADGSWTPPSQFFDRIERGHYAKKKFVTPSWPQKLALSMQSSDAWGFWKLVINGKVILEDPAGIRGSDEYRSHHVNDHHQVVPLPADEARFLATEYWIEGPPASQSFAVPSLPAALDVSAIAVVASTADKEYADTTGCTWVAFLVGTTWAKHDFFCGASRGEQKQKVFSVGGRPSRVQLGLDSTDEWGFWRVSVAGMVVYEDPAGHSSGNVFTGLSGEDLHSYWMEGPGRTKTFDIPSDGGEGQVPATHTLQGLCKRAWTWEMYCDLGSAKIIDELAATEALGRGQALLSEGHAEVACNVSDVTYSLLGTGFGSAPSSRQINYCRRAAGACRRETQLSCEAVCARWEKCQGYSYGHSEVTAPTTCVLYPKAQVHECPETFQGQFDHGDASLEMVDHAERVADWLMPAKTHRKNGDAGPSCYPSRACLKAFWNYTEAVVEGVMQVMMTNAERFARSANARQAVADVLWALLNLDRAAGWGAEAELEVSLLLLQPAAGRRLLASEGAVLEVHFSVFLRSFRDRASSIATRLEEWLTRMNPSFAQSSMEDVVARMGLNPSQMDVLSIQPAGQVTPSVQWTKWNDRAENFLDRDDDSEDTITLNKITMSIVLVAITVAIVCGGCIIMGLSFYVCRLRRKAREASQYSHNAVIEGADVAIGRPVDGNHGAPTDGRAVKLASI